MKFNSRYLEQAVDEFLLEADHSFKLAEAVQAVSDILAAEPGDKDEVTQEVEILLKEYHLFFNADDQMYTTQDEFFKNVQFCLTPSEYEIKQGYLIPGHRFSPFACDSVFPSEIEITIEGSADPVQTIDQECAIHDAASFHTLLGSEEMFHYFIADHQENQAIIAAGDPEAHLLLTVFDLAEFYSNNDFKIGDALLFTVEDWDNGIFNFKYQSQADRVESDKKKWSEAFESALKQVFDDRGYYTSIPDQLALAYFIAQKAIIDTPALSIDEFISSTDKVEIIMVGGQTVLWEREDESALSEEDAYTPDQDVMVSQGSTDSLLDLLKDIGCGITPVELDSLMYNEMFQGGESLEPIIDRVLYFKGDSFSDDAQEAVFLNFIEERWEDLTESYRRDSDQDKGAIRRRIMHFLDERLRFFLELDKPKETLQEELVESLDNNIENMNNLLALINSDHIFDDEGEFDKVMEGVERMGEVQANILFEIESTINEQ